MTMYFFEIARVVFFILPLCVAWFHCLVFSQRRTLPKTFTVFSVLAFAFYCLMIITTTRISGNLVGTYIESPWFWILFMGLILFSISSLLSAVFTDLKDEQNKVLQLSGTNRWIRNAWRILLLAFVLFTGWKIATVDGWTLNDSYSVVYDRAYYLDYPIEGADTKSLRALSSVFAKDGKAAYFQYFPIPFSDFYSFWIIRGNIAKDKDRVYCMDRTLSTRPESFSILDWWYSKDDIDAYSWCEAIQGADALTFVTIGFGYAHDSKAVYFWTRKVQGANPETFIATSYGRGIDWERKYSLELETER